MIGLFTVNCLFEIPLFAIGIEDVITIVVFLAVAIISAISQYFKKKEEADRQRRLEQQAKRRAATAELEQREKKEQVPGRRPQEIQRPFGPARQRSRKPAAAPVDEDVAAEIRDFLERVATGRPAGPAKPIPPVVAVPAASAKEKHVPLADRPAHHSSIERRPIPTSHHAEEKSLSDRQRAEQERRRRQQYLAEKQAEVKRRRAAAAKAKLSEEQKGRSKFDHELGSLEKKTSHRASKPVAVPTPVTMATDIAAMFASTENLRQAIVINEILTRPVHRWE